jgi:hypothetical protein
MKKYTKADKIAYHDAWLRKRGLHPSQLKNAVKQSAPIPSYKSDCKSLPTSDRVGNGFVKGKNSYSGSGVHIGQAYNKGNLVVLSSKEASDSATGKRR